MGHQGQCEWKISPSISIKAVHWRRNQEAPQICGETHAETGQQEEKRDKLCAIAVLLFCDRMSPLESL